MVGKDQDLVIYSDEGVAPYVSFDSELVFSQIICFLRLWLQLCQSGRGMCCVTCCHSMSSLCDISITKRRLCLIMQVEMAKKTQGCISYGFLSAKQRKDSFVSCYYKGWHLKAPLLALCAWNSLSLGLILCFIYFVVNVIIIYKCKEIGYEQSKSLCLVCQHHCFFCWFFFSLFNKHSKHHRKRGLLLVC